MRARSKTGPEIRRSDQGRVAPDGRSQSAETKDDGQKNDFGREANLATYAEERGTLVGRIDRVYGALSGIEGLIDRIAQVLRISQPPMRRKIDLRWWVVSGKPYRDPVPVRWIWVQKMARYVPRKVQRVSVRQHANFQLNSKETVEALHLFRRWEAERKKLREKLRLLKQITSQLGGLERVIAEERGYLDGLWYQVTQNLLESGIDLDAETLAEVRRLENGE